jgi:hypothetical protein
MTRPETTTYETETKTETETYETETIVFGLETETTSRDLTSLKNSPLLSASSSLSFTVPPKVLLGRTFRL